MIGIEGVGYLAHRLAWLYMTGEWPPAGVEVDHVDTNPNNNKWCNLRLLTHSENGFNRGANRNNKTGLKGVHFHKKANKWVAQIVVNGENVYLGLFDSAEVAKIAYDAAARLYHGDYAHA